MKKISGVLLILLTAAFALPLAALIVFRRRLLPGKRLSGRVRLLALAGFAVCQIAGSALCYTGEYRADYTYNFVTDRAIPRFGLTASLGQRRQMKLLYLKGQSAISDMLSIFGANTARFAMEDAYIRKELRNNANRAVNCDSANVQRAVTAAARQTQAIERLIAAKGEDSLPPQLQETARLRLQHPEMSLEELGMMCDPPVGKSGVNHRMRRLEQMAAELDK